MDITKASSSGLAGWLASILLVLVALPALAGAAEVLIEGFEKAKTLKTSGKVAVVKGADAVTQGAGALQLSPDAKVTITIPAKAISKVGWLKIDTFEVQPVMASLQLTLGSVFSRRGYVSPGKDTLLLPLGLAARAYRGPWPVKPITLELHNIGRHAIVIDNVRLAEPANPPAGAVLLDFGPPNQVLWPGFAPAGTEGAGIAWSGNHRIYSYSSRYPDNLLGDFTGRRMEYKQPETITLQSKGLGMAWVWLTHYCYDFSAPMEYAAKLNRRSVLRKRLSPTQMLSPEGLLRGKNQPWTTEWFHQSFVPAIVSKLDFPLKAGKNRLELVNCQLAALIIAPRTSRDAARDYVRQLEQDLQRYRRQFILAGQHRSRCNIAPTEAEAKAGTILFLPSADEWFGRAYTPKPEHRGKEIKLTLAAGSSAMVALAATPCKDGRLLNARLDVLRDFVGKGLIPKTAWRIYALETMPVVENGRVYYQPFLPVRDFRAVKAEGIYWFVLCISAPERTRAGKYKGAVHVTLDRTSAQLPVELEVVRIGDGKTDRKRTFAVMSTADCFGVYRSLKNALSPQHRAKASREILTRLFGAGLNASAVQGPTLSHALRLNQSPMVQDLRNYPHPERSGKALVGLSNIHWMLSARRIQTGTARYSNITIDAVRMCNNLAAKNKLSNYALYCGYGRDAGALSEVAKRAATVRRAKGGRAAVGAGAAALSNMPADQRAGLLASLDTLICTPDHKSLGGLGEKFKKTGSGKTFALRLDYPDVYAVGFYCWGVGADGAYAGAIFHHRPLYNAFSFSPRSLLVPTPKGEFEPTLTLLKFVQGIDDYDLARHCQVLARKARKRSVATAALEKILTEIRIAADRRPPGYNVRLMRAGSVSPQRLQKWRTSLIREAGKVYEEMTKK